MDIDHHGEPDEELAELNLRAAKAWFDRLREMGFEPLLIDSNGYGGFHLMVLFAESVESKVIFNFGGWLVDDWQEHDLRERPELFPNQPSLDVKTPFGNWLRLPGRHHTLEFVSRVWSGQEWLSGDQAIDVIVQSSGQSEQHIPKESLDYVHPKPAGPKFGFRDPDGYDRPVVAILKRLSSSVSQSGSGWSADCPAHDD